MKTSRGPLYTGPAEPPQGVGNKAKQEPDRRARLSTMRVNQSASTTLTELQPSRESSVVTPSADQSGLSPDAKGKQEVTGQGSLGGPGSPPKALVPRAPLSSHQVEWRNPPIRREKPSVTGASPPPRIQQPSLNSSSSPDRSIPPRSSLPILDYDDDGDGVPLAQPPLLSRTPPKNEPERQWRKEISDDFRDDTFTGSSSRSSTNSSSSVHQSEEETYPIPREEESQPPPVIPMLHFPSGGIRQNSSLNLSSPSNTPRSILKRDGESPRSRSGRRISFVENGDNLLSQSDESSQQSNEPALHYSHGKDGDHDDDEDNSALYRDPSYASHTSSASSSRSPVRSTNDARYPDYRQVSAPDDEFTDVVGGGGRQPSYKDHSGGSNSINSSSSIRDSNPSHSVDIDRASRDSSREKDHDLYGTRTQPHQLVCHLCGSSLHTSKHCPNANPDSTLDTNSTTSTDDFISPIKPTVEVLPEAVVKTSPTNRLPRRVASSKGVDSNGSVSAPKELSHTQPHDATLSPNTKRGPSRSRSLSSSRASSEGGRRRSSKGRHPRRRSSSLVSTSLNDILDNGEAPAVYIAPIIGIHRDRITPQPRPSDYTIVPQFTEPHGEQSSRLSLSDSGGVDPGDFVSDRSDGKRHRRRRRDPSGSRGSRRRHSSHSHRKRDSKEPSPHRHRSRSSRRRSVDPCPPADETNPKVMRKKLVVVKRRKSGDTPSESDPVVQVSLYPIEKKKELVKSPKKLESLLDYVRGDQDNDPGEEGRHQFRRALSTVVSRHSSRRTSVAPSRAHSARSRHSRASSSTHQHRRRRHSSKDEPAPLTLQELLAKMAQDQNPNPPPNKEEAFHDDVRGPQGPTPTYGVPSWQTQAKEREGIIPISLRMFEPIVTKESAAMASETHPVAPLHRGAYRRETDITVSDMTDYTRHNSIAPTPLVISSAPSGVVHPRVRSASGVGQVPLVEYGVLKGHSPLAARPAASHPGRLSSATPIDDDDDDSFFLDEEPNFLGGDSVHSYVARTGVAPLASLIRPQVVTGDRWGEGVVECTSRASQTPVKQRLPISATSAGPTSRKTTKRDPSPPYAPPLKDQNMDKLSKEWQETLRKENDKRQKEMYLLETAANGAVDGGDPFYYGGGEDTEKRENQSNVVYEEPPVSLPRALLPYKSVSPEAEARDPSLHPSDPFPHPYRSRSTSHLPYPSLSPLEQSLLEEEAAYQAPLATATAAAVTDPERKKKKEKDKDKKESKKGERKSSSRRSSREKEKEKETKNKEKRRHSKQSSLVSEPPKEHRSSRHPDSGRSSKRMSPRRDSGSDLDEGANGVSFNDVNESPSVSFRRASNDEDGIGSRTLSHPRLASPFYLTETTTEMHSPSRESKRKKKREKEKEKKEKPEKHSKRSSPHRRRSSSAGSRRSKSKRDHSPSKGWEVAEIPASLLRDDRSTSLEYQLLKIQMKQKEKEEKRERKKSGARKEKKRKESASPSRKKRSSSEKSHHHKSKKAEEKEERKLHRSPSRKSRHTSPDRHSESKKRKKDKEKEKKKKEKDHHSKKDKKRKHSRKSIGSFTFPNVSPMNDERIVLSPAADPSLLSSVVEEALPMADHFEARDAPSEATTATRSKYASLDDYRERRRREAREALMALRQRREEGTATDREEVESMPSFSIPLSSITSAARGMRPSTRWTDYVKEAEREARRGSCGPLSFSGRSEPNERGRYSGERDKEKENSPDRRKDRRSSEGLPVHSPPPRPVSESNYGAGKNGFCIPPVRFSDDSDVLGGEGAPPKEYFNPKKQEEKPAPSPSPLEKSRDTNNKSVESLSRRNDYSMETKLPSPVSDRPLGRSGGGETENGVTTVSDPALCAKISKDVNRIATSLEFFYKK